MALPAELGADEPAPLEGIRAHIDRIERNLEILRLEMGASEPAGGHIILAGATPREVLFLAYSLYDRAYRLCFDRTRESPPRPVLPPVERIEAADSAAALALVDDRLDCARKTLAPPSVEVDQDEVPIRDLSDVATWILNANRRLDQLLRRPAGPSDVFREVTLAVSYSSRILTTFPGAHAIPEPPPFERHRRPEHVFQRLNGCLDRAREISSGLGAAGATVEPASDVEIDPSLVLDMATLLVANLAYLHSLRTDAGPPIQPFEPGFKTPSHVFQRVGIVETQIEQLLALIAGTSRRTAESGWSTP